MSVRKRPVITVVEARPMDQVGFRDNRAVSGASEVPKLSPPPGKAPPISRPPVPSNSNSAFSDPDGIYGIPRKPVPSENRIPSDLTNALNLDNQLNQPSHPPPKPRRAAEPRPMTIHFDGLNNNLLPDRPFQLPLLKPVATKRTTVRPDEATTDTVNSNLPGNAWNTDFLDPPAPTKVKPEVAAKRPTIIRVSTVEAKPEGGLKPPPVANKSQAAKRHAAERLSAFDEAPSDGSDARPSTKPKPATRPKPEAGFDADPTEDRPPSTGDIVRKRPTIIRPSSVHGSFGLQGTSNSKPASNSNTTGPNPSVPNALPRHFPPSEAPSENAPAPTRTTPTIIRPEFPTKQPEIPARQQPEIPAKHPEKPAFVAPQPKKRPNIIRPGVDPGRKVPPESTVTIASGTVHFSASGSGAALSPVATSPDILPEKENAENWKRIEMVGPTAAPSHALGGQDGVIRKPPQSELRQPPSKPPPPRVTSDGRRQSALVDSKSQSSESVAPRPSGIPARPTAGPTIKPTRPNQPTKRISSVTEMAPSLPRRPTLGHPLFHYVVAGPHAIALFDYKTTQPDELQFNAGTVILLEKWINAEWLQGRTADASGMFPCSFVDVIEAPGATSATAEVPSASSSVTAEVVFASSASWPGKGPRCCARFDYDGEDPADLAFVAGDIVRLVERVGNEWMKGELNGKVGMFPVGFVEIIEDLPPAQESASASSQGGSEDGSTVLFDFLGQHGELSLLSGTRVKILGVVNTEWLYGEFEGERGRFPKNFVDHVPSGLPLFEDQQPPTATHNKVIDGPHCVALYDFVGQNPDDLSFSAGECISLLAHVSDDWMEGEVNARRGLFPASFVQIVKDVDELPPRPKVANDMTPVDMTPVDSTPVGMTPVGMTHGTTAHDANVGFGSKDNSHSVPTAEKSSQAVAIYDFPGQTADDLTFSTGDVIEVTGVIDGDWMSGRIGERSGIFPASFVNILS